MEGKFEVRKPISVTQPATRQDKYFQYNLANLDGVDEVKSLRQMTRLLFFLPFEINKKYPLSLQVSEHFTISYFDQNNQSVQWRQESDFGERDTGVKLALFYVLTASKENQGRITVKKIAKGEDKTIEVSSNTLVMFNARAFSYQIQQPGIAFIAHTMVSGPAQPPAKIGAAFI